MHRIDPQHTLAGEYPCLQERCGRPSVSDGLHFQGLLSCALIGRRVSARNKYPDAALTRIFSWINKMRDERNPRAAGSTEPDSTEPDSTDHSDTSSDGSDE